MTVSSHLAFLANTPVIEPFADRLNRSRLLPLRATAIDVLQMNVGYRCNLSCKHCHVEAGPDRTETMARPVFEKCLKAAEQSGIGTIDVTGGAPEMNENLGWFLETAGLLVRRIMVRTNLVILLETGFSPMIDRYAALKIEVIASLPHFQQSRGEALRGRSTFMKSIEALRRLNDRGYGQSETGLILNLVHNPAGAYLPAAQKTLEDEYRHHLLTDHGVVFNRLFSLTNCPVGRYLEYLVYTDNYQDYMETLAGSYSTKTAANVMCRTILSVGWDGTLYDCDFNQMLGLPVNHGTPHHIDQFDSHVLSAREIMVNNHCYACTAGAGSSCQGATISA
jgi:radical SAM/Cys-rich protein